MPSPDEIGAAARDAAQTYGVDQYAAGALSRQPEVDALKATEVVDVATIAGLRANLTALQAAFDAYRANHPDPEPPAPKLKVGVYQSGNNAKVGNGLGLWSAYLRFDQLPSAVGVEAALAAGQDVILAVDSKAGGGVYKPWADFTTGKYDTQLKALRDDALRLLTKYPDRELWVAFVHEQNLRSNYNPPKCAAGDTAATYVPAANHVADLMNAGGNNRLLPLHWTASGNTAFLPDKTRFAGISADPYKTGTHPVAETASQTWKPFADFCDQNGWTDARKLITESGIKTDAFSNGGQFDVSTQRAFYASWRQGMVDNGIEGAVWFRANSGQHDYIPTDPSVDAAFDAMAAAL